MNKKLTYAEWYNEKEQPRHKNFHDGNYGGDLLFRARTKSLKVTVMY